jgi:hypothetical protein
MLLVEEVPNGAEAVVGDMQQTARLQMMLMTTTFWLEDK